MLALAIAALLASASDLVPTCGDVSLPAYDQTLGLPPAPIGTRQVFNPDSYSGNDSWKLYQASQAASQVGGAVVLNRIYNIQTWFQLWGGVLYTGGGVRRLCDFPAFDLAQNTGDPYPNGIIIDSMVFDGNRRACGSDNNWATENALGIRGRNIVRNSIFYDSPSEGIVICGTLVENNVGYELGGSFVHKSCATGQEAADFLIGNRVAHTNLLTDAVLGHSEGVVTLSSNAGAIYLEGNVFTHGSEGVLGLAVRSSEGIIAVNDCYEDFPRLMQLYNDVRREMFRFTHVKMIDVGP